MTRTLRLKWAGTDRYITKGDVTGDTYEFFHDKTTEVDARDADGLLSLDVKQTVCCGGPPAITVKVLEEVEE